MIDFTRRPARNILRHERLSYWERGADCWKLTDGSSPDSHRKEETPNNVNASMRIHVAQVNPIFLKPWKHLNPFFWCKHCEDSGDLSRSSEAWVRVQTNWDSGEIRHRLCLLTRMRWSPFGIHIHQPSWFKAQPALIFKQAHIFHFLLTPFGILLSLNIVVFFIKTVIVLGGGSNSGRVVVCKLPEYTCTGSKLNCSVELSAE